MDIGSFFTLQIPRDEIKLAGGNTSGSSVQSPLAGLNFLDFILATLNQETSGAAGKPPADLQLKEAEKHELLGSENPVLDPEIDLAGIIAANPEIREDIKTWMLESDAKLSQVLALNQKALDDALKPETCGMITCSHIKVESPRLLQALLVHSDEGHAASGKGGALEKLQAILTKLENLASGKEPGGLVLTNLTPEQITDIKNKIEVLVNENAEATISEDDRKKAIEGIYLGLIKLVSPDEQSKAAALQPAMAALKAAALGSSEPNSKPSPLPGQIPSSKHADADAGTDINAKANPLTRPAGTDIARSDAREAWIDEGRMDGNGTGKDKFSNLLQDFSPKKSPAQTGAQSGTQTGANAPSSPAPGVKPGFSALQGWPFDLNGSIFTPAQWSNVPYDDIAAHGPALATGGLGTLTSLVTQAHAASRPHPAIQAVAATISKAATNGESKNITLHLDPPELGRVEIRMSFGKDKAVKAVLVAEKPETLAMLQRDAHSLERILVDSGLDAGGSSLSFELAGEGYDFNRPGQGSDGSGGYASGNNDGGEIIESTMTWRVDPETGHMRYSILA